MGVIYEKQQFWFENQSLCFKRDNLVPLRISCGSFLGFAIYGFMFTYDGGKISKNYETGLGFVTVYQLQMYVNKIQDDLLQGDPAQTINDAETRSFIDGISETGADVAIFKNEDLIYVNGGFTEEGAVKIAEEYSLFTKNSSEFYTGSSGSVLFSCRPIPGGGYLRILFSDDQLNNIIGETNEGMLNDLLILQSVYLCLYQ